MVNRNKDKKYVASFVITIFVILLALQFVNYMVDPLWYYSGNRIFPENYTYHERYSKTNYYLRDPKKYDCILFGSSKVTLIDPRFIKNYTCFNFSFSGGTIVEFIDYLEYVKAVGVIPKLVIVGVDEDSFIENPLPRDVPEFILKKERTPPVLAAYISYDAINFSVRTLLKRSLRPRYYNASFVGDILPNAHPFNKKKAKAYVIRRDGEYYRQNLQYFEQLRANNPGMIFWGYVPPFSAYLYNEMEKTGALDKYLRLIYIAQKQFSKFYDFSVPGELTAGTHNTYDGMHFDHKTNENVINALNGSDLGNGINVKKMTLSEYLAAHRVALQKFRRKYIYR